jgi:stage II sporulation protein GA (sporulation sigma-E factor processing peptidase)
MDVYLEFVVIDNMVINSLVLYAALKTLRRKIKIYKLLLSAALGTVLAVFLPFLGGGIFVFALKVLAASLMVYVSGGYKNIKDFFAVFLLFLVYTFLLGGLCIAALNFLNVDFSDAATLNYIAEIPIGLLLLCAVLFCCFIIRLARFIYKKKDISSFFRSVKIYIDDDVIDAEAYLDSGNRLYDKDYPVVVVNKKLLSKVLSDKIVNGLILKKQKNNLNALNTHYIDVKTVAGSRAMLVFKPQKIVIYFADGANIIDRLMIGVSEEKMKYDVLLHGSML